MTYVNIFVITSRSDVTLPCPTLLEQGTAKNRLLLWQLSSSSSSPRWVTVSVTGLCRRAELGKVMMSDSRACPIRGQSLKPLMLCVRLRLQTEPPVAAPADTASGPAPLHRHALTATPPHDGTCSAALLWKNRTLEPCW